MLMKTDLVVVLALSALLGAGAWGCASKARTSSEAIQFRSFDPALIRTVEKIRELCPPGTKASVARERLGPRCRLVRYHGLSISMGSDQKPGGWRRFEDWVLEYETPSGVVCLELDWPSGERCSLDAAAVSAVRAMQRVVLDPE